MENFGSEIGQKMRSAVKAKLLELGTGGSAGYIDDELPDYVMIMVANKRSKQQMITDLNLFLGSQTELFVTWLHEVLQKLQEVTLPAATATAKKRKSNQKEEPSTKKDKKTNKKEKKTGKKTGEENDTTATHTETEKQQKPEAASSRSNTQAGSSKVAGTTPVINSITDVFAEEFLGKAKKNLDVSVATAAQIKKGKMRKISDETTPTTEATEETNEFDIPTISEISSTTGGSATGSGGGNNTNSGSDIIISGDRAKDLAELAEIRRKISAAKKHLKEIGELNDDLGSGDDEDDDEDILSMRDYADELNEEQKPDKKSATKTPKSPIIFETDNDKQPEKQSQPETVPKSPSKLRQPTPPSAIRSSHSESQIVERTTQSGEKRELATENARKRPVHERLGLKLSADSHESARERRQRPEQELYVPGFRRREVDGNKDKEREVRHREADRNDRERDRDRGRMRERERQREREKDDLPSKKRVEFDERRRRASPEKPTSTVVNEERRSVHAKVAIERGKRSADSENDDNEGLPQQRMGSHVIIAPPKVTEPSDDEDMKEKPVNSVIKIKPRPPMSPSKQACKNLLLRAMAEAQRSTIVQKASVKKEPAVGGLKVTARLGQRRSKMSMRERIKQNVVSSSGAGGAGPSLLRRATQNLVIEIESGNIKRSALRKRHERAFKLEPQDELMLAEAGEDPDWNYMHSLKAAYNESGDEGDQSPEVVEYETQIKPNEIETESEVEDVTNNIESMKTQFVVTLNDDKAPGKYKSRTRSRSRNLSRSRSPVPQVSSSSSAGRSNGAEASSTTSALAALSHGKESRSRPRNSHKVDIKSRLLLKSSASSSPTAGLRHSSNSSPVSNTPPPPTRRTEIIEMYRKSVKKLIIKNDSEDDELSPKKSVAGAASAVHSERPRSNDRSQQSEGEKKPRSTTPPLPPLPPSNKLREKRISKTPPLHSSPHKHKRTLIKFDLEKSAKRSSGDEHSSNRKRERRSRSLERERERERDRDSSGERRNGEDRRKISIRSSEAKKYDNIPSLSSMAMDSTSSKAPKPKERCKYHPNCTKQFCDFYHPTAPCKAFPNCKFADKCIYSHPKCMYDMACTNIDCNYSHSGPRNPNLLQPTAPPLSSHVVPVQNYKTISSPAASSTMCKYYPNCTKVSCTFYHPKPCRFGKNCINKLECNFYHHELQSSNKFKWVASVV